MSNDDIYVFVAERDGPASWRKSSYARTKSFVVRVARKVWPYLYSALSVIVAILIFIAYLMVIVMKSLTR